MDFTEKTKKKFKVLFMGNASLVVLSLFTILWSYLKISSIETLLGFSNIDIYNTKIFIFVAIITIISVISVSTRPYLLFRTNKQESSDLSSKDLNRLSIKGHQKISGIVYSLVTAIYVIFAFLTMDTMANLKKYTSNMSTADTKVFIGHIYSFLSVHFITLLIIFMFYTSIFIMTYQIMKKLIIFIRHDKGLSPSRD